MLMPALLPVSGRESSLRDDTKFKASDSTRRTRLLQTHAASAIIAARVFANQFHSGAAQRIDDPGQRFDDAADIADARFHPLDRWQ
jgi:hypothetical protein